MEVKREQQIEKASVIMAVWNGEKTVRKSVESILAQSHEDLELIVVDDGSTDKTAEIVKSFKDERVRYFYQENSGGPSAPRNKGIREARGDFVAFCDQEDLYYPDKLGKQMKMYAEMDDKESVGIIISSADIIDEQGKKVDSNKVPFEGFLGPKESFNLLLRGDFITACSAMVPKKVLDEVGSLDESLKGVDDYDLWLRITKKYGILAVSETLCAWRKSESSLSSDKSRLYIETEKVFDKLGDDDVVRVGHGKNLMRVVVSLILDRRFTEVSKYNEKALGYPISFKAKVIIKIYKMSPAVAFCLLKILDKLGLVSL